MDDEPWDSLSGPGVEEGDYLEGDLQVPMVRGRDPPVRTGFQAPPTEAFQGGAGPYDPPQWTTPSPSDTKKANHLPIEDESEEEEEGVETDGFRIRQEALKMIQVADDQLAGSSYAVYRTATGGFTATPKSMGKQKRVPTALSALQYKASRTNAAKSYRDEPYSDTTSTEASTREDYEYGDEDVVDVISMEKRSSDTRTAAEDTSKHWSSRYSLDSTLMALSGGSLSSRKFLDDLDRKNGRKSATGLMRSSAYDPRLTRTFGKGFSFRSNNKVDIREPNLRTVWMDKDRDSMPPAEPRKSWQDQVAEKQRKRRLYIIIAVAFAVFIIALSAGIASGRKRYSGSSTDSGNGSAADEVGTVTFYVFANTPFHKEDQDKLTTDLQTVEPGTSFIVHLGSIQNASITECAEWQFDNVADVLRGSPTTTFVLPGQDDWPNCPDPDAAWGNWTENFAFFESQFDHDFEISHQISRMENFAFTKNGVVFIGAHVVGGEVYTAEEIQGRNDNNFEWVKEIINTIGYDASAIVVFANAAPQDIRENDQFFWDMSNFLSSTNKPVLYVHASEDGDGLYQYKPFPNAGNILGLQIGPGGDEAPTKIVTGSGTKPFVITSE